MRYALEKMKYWKWFCLVGVGILGCGDDSTLDPPGDAGVSVGQDLLVDVDWVEARLGDANLQLIDSRSGLAFDTNHLPGAINLVPFDLADTRDGVPGQVATASKTQAALRAVGLRNGVTAVVYGTSPEYDSARVAWVLTYYSHGDVRWMDGGYEAWVANGGPLESGAATTRSSSYDIGAANENLRATGAEVLNWLGEAPYSTPAVSLIDARAPGEFSVGRVPTATHVQWTTNLDGGFMKTVEEVRALYPAFENDDTIVTYCLTGWRASVSWFALRWLGYEDVRVYDGSWAEWNNGSFPVETP